MSDYIVWNSYIIRDNHQPPKVFNEMFETKMGIFVKTRTIITNKSR